MYLAEGLLCKCVIKCPCALVIFSLNLTSDLTVNAYVSALIPLPSAVLAVIVVEPPPITLRTTFDESR